MPGGGLESGEGDRRVGTRLLASPPRSAARALATASGGATASSSRTRRGPPTRRDAEPAAEGPASRPPATRPERDSPGTRSGPCRAASVLPVDAAISAAGRRSSTSTGGRPAKPARATRSRLARRRAPPARAPGIPARPAGAAAEHRARRSPQMTTPKARQGSSSPTPAARFRAPDRGGLIERARPRQVEVVGREAGAPARPSARPHAAGVPAAQPPRGCHSQRPRVAQVEDLHGRWPRWLASPAPVIRGVPGARPSRNFGSEIGRRALSARRRLELVGERRLPRRRSDGRRRATSSVGGSRRGRRVHRLVGGNTSRPARCPRGPCRLPPELAPILTGVPAAA